MSQDERTFELEHTFSPGLTLLGIGTAALESNSIKDYINTKFKVKVPRGTKVVQLILTKFEMEFGALGDPAAKQLAMLWVQVSETKNNDGFVQLVDDTAEILFGAVLQDKAGAGAAVGPWSGKFAIDILCFG